MNAAEWLPPAGASVVFTTLAVCKIYGWMKGVIGGGGKPAACRLMGRCPNLSNRVNIAIIVVFAAVGILNFAIFLRALGAL